MVGPGYVPGLFFAPEGVFRNIGSGCTNLYILIWLVQVTGFPCHRLRSLDMSFRKPVSKSKGARKFRSQMGRTKAANVAQPPARGGFRL